MSIRIVRLGSPRAADEGLCIGTVRHPPRGVPQAEYGARDYYDVWLPELAPSAGLVKVARASTDDGAWRAFERQYRTEMKQSPMSRILDLLAALSHHTNMSVGCYCENEERCHRAVLRELLAERGADVRCNVTWLQ